MNVRAFGRNSQSPATRIPSWMVKLIIAGVVATMSGVAGVLIRHERAIAANETNMSALMDGFGKMERRFDRLDSKFDRLIDRNYGSRN